MSILNGILGFGIGFILGASLYVNYYAPEPITQTKEVKVYIGKEEERCEKMGGKMEISGFGDVKDKKINILSYRCLSPEKVLFSSDSTSTD